MRIAHKSRPEATMILRSLFCLMVAVSVATGATAQTMQWEDYSPVSTLVVPENPISKAKYSFVDVHGHQWGVGTKTPEEIQEVVAAMDAMNMGVMVNLSGGYGEALAAAVNASESVAPGRIVHFANIDFSRIDEPNFGENAAQQLHEDFNNGARGLKIFKNLGMSVFFESGERLHTDDVILDPIWAKAGELGIPVLIHTADPAQFWLPHDKFNERWFELKERPRRKRDPEPSWQLLIDEQWNVFRKHPGTTFINAHLGWLGNDLGRLGELMEEFPNMVTELGAVIAELGRQPHTARAWLTEYQDRVMMGKDSWNPSEYDTYFRVFETADEFFPYYRKRHAWWTMYGLDLPDEVLRKIYYKNALRIVPGLDTSLFPDDWNLDVVPAPEPILSPMRLARTTLGDTYVKVHYGSPARRGREIFGGLVPYDELWRTAANEATEITFTGDVMFGGESVPAGTYALFTVPGEESWTVILNSDLGQNGTNSYREEADVARVVVSASQMDEIHESFMISFEDEQGLVMTWERTRVVVPLAAP